MTKDFFLMPLDFEATFPSTDHTDGRVFSDLSRENVS